MCEGEKQNEEGDLAGVATHVETPRSPEHPWGPTGYACYGSTGLGVLPIAVSVQTHGGTAR